MTPFEEITLNFVTERLFLGMTQQDVAKSSGVSQATIAKFENGQLENISFINLTNLVVGLNGNVEVTI